MTLIEAIAVTAELLGTDLSKGALLAMEDELSRYPEKVTIDALSRCRRELSGRLTLAEVIKRIEEADGRPGPEEAWAIALTANDEAQTVVWTDEIAEAFVTARPILDAGDEVGARMAFRESYARLLRQARQHGWSLTWTISPGWDRDLRTEAIKNAVFAGRISSDQAEGLLPAPAEGGPVAQLLLTGNVVPHPAMDKARLAGLRRAIEEGKAKAEEREAAKQKQREERLARIEEERQAALDFVNSRTGDSQPDRKAES